MPEPDTHVELPARETQARKPPLPVAPRVTPDEAMDDEEKVLAGRLDANFPALLTRDVPGG